jgi:hypothetical protein
VCGFWCEPGGNTPHAEESIFERQQMTPTETVIADTRAWLERAVIALNLCPFAKSVHVKGQVHYAVSRASTWKELLRDLENELKALAESDATLRDTTLLISPDCMHDFMDFIDFLADADRALVNMDLEGVLQIASLHPRYQFAGTLEDDITNCTNRAPYPTLHLLREDSIDRAVAAFPDAEAIFEVNIRTMERLGPEGWAALKVGASQPREAGVASSGDDT